MGASKELKLVCIAAQNDFKLLQHQLSLFKGSFEQRFDSISYFELESCSKLGQRIRLYFDTSQKDLVLAVGLYIDLSCFASDPSIGSTHAE